MDISYLSQQFGLPGRTALVTGSARGIGYSIAQALGHAGARVVINDLQAQPCAEAVQALQAQGRRWTPPAGPSTSWSATLATRTARPWSR